MVISERLKQLGEEYNNAAYLESSVRECAFLPITLTIAGVEVKQFTPYHYILLDFIKSPFLGKSEDQLGVEDVVQFLWIVSTNYRDSGKEAKKEFIKHLVLNINAEEAVKEISEYLEQAFLDVPPVVEKSEKVEASYFAWIIHYIDIIASEYHWKDIDIMEMPFARILQYVKVIEARKLTENGKPAPMYNKISDRIKWDIRAEVEEQNKKKDSECQI